MAERFTLLAELGRGGMGVVWKARDEETGQVVALKLLHAAFAVDADYVTRFERELELARRIHSAHVVEVLGFGARDGAPYLALEYVDGSSLRELLTSHGPYSWPETKALLVQIAQGLADAHAAGVVHRDLKPSNVLIGPDGVPKLADFGIAKGLDLTRVTGTSTLLGTPAYLAPEGPLDERSDLYSLGIIAYELLAGVPPFAGSTYQEVIVRHIREAPDLGKLPPEAQNVVGWLLAKDPAARPQEAGDLLAVLRGERPTPPIVATATVLRTADASQPGARGEPNTGAADNQGRSRRRRVTGLPVAGIACLVVVGSAGAVWGISRPGSTGNQPGTTVQSPEATILQSRDGQSSPSAGLGSPAAVLSASSSSPLTAGSPTPTTSAPLVTLSTPGPTSRVPPAITPTPQPGSGQTPTAVPQSTPTPTPTPPPAPTPSPTPSPTPATMFVNFSLASANPLSVGSYATFNVQSLVGATCQLSSHFVSGPGPDPGDATSEPFTISLPALYQIQLAVAYPAGTYNFKATCTASGGAPTVTSPSASVTWQ